VSRVATNAGFGLGGALGGLVAARGLNGFVALFLANALTYLLYVVVLVAVVREEARPERLAGGYRLILRDRAFVHLALANVAVIAVGWGGLPWLVPPFARNSLGVGAQLIGVLMLANATTVVVAQVPVARFAEGRRRVVMMAAGASFIAAAFVLVVSANAYAALVVAAVVIGVGECFHTSALMPLVADLAPPALRGRYMAAMGLSWWVGLALAPTLGTELLSVSAALTFAACTVTAGAAAVSLLTLERRLPDAARLTPRPVHA
jgi:MFS family permease